MIDLRTAAQQALEALEGGADSWQRVGPAIDALKAALAEPVQEPVAIVGTQADTWKGHEGQWLPPGPPIKTVHMLRELPEGTLLYTPPPQPAQPQKPVAWVHTNGTSDTKWHPPQRKPLTEGEISNIWDGHVVPVFGKNGINPIVFARAIEAKHGIV